MSRIALLFVLFAPMAVLATTVRLLSEPDMVAQSAVIVRGTVTGVATRLDHLGIIVTDVTVEVARLIKSDQSAERLTFTQLGGTVGERTLVVSGTSRYTPGEEVVVFLEHADRGLVELGVGAAKYSVARDAAGAMVRRELGGVGFVRMEGIRGVPTEPPLTTPEPLTTFEARLAGYVER